MDFVDYANPPRYRRDYPLILFNTIKYFLLIILSLSAIFLFIIICVFLVNQEAWIQSATNELESTISTINSNQINNHDANQPPPSSSISLNPTQSTNPSGSSEYKQTLINLQLEMFQIKLSLALIYLVIGFISVLSDDFNSTFFFALASLIGFLFSLVKKNNQIQLEIMIYTIITSLLSFLYCLLLRVNVKDKSSYYYGYLAS